MHELSGEQRFLNSAKKVVEGIMHFRVERNGAAFPGELSSRLCCDYGTGSAGIALFLNRLLKKQKSDFMLDSLFERSPWGRAHTASHAGPWHVVEQHSLLLVVWIMQQEPERMTQR